MVLCLITFKDHKPNDLRNKDEQFLEVERDIVKIDAELKLFNFYSGMCVLAVDFLVSSSFDDAK